jgi:class 3 adenylate cyclase
VGAGTAGVAAAVGDLRVSVRRGLLRDRAMSTHTVTVLFTDLVGSTALLSRVGEDHAEALRREHFGVLREAVGGHDGREVKNLGDGLMVAFDAVSSALSCAIAMQQGIETRNRDAGEPLFVRVAVAHGEADVEDGDYFGVPVVEASRLCGRTAGGEILTTELVRLLAGSRGGFEFERLGSMDLKGLEIPVEAIRVRWSPTPLSVPVDVSLPSRLSAAVSGTFVGRDGERARLNGAFKSLGEGERRVVLIGGEPGIGKTTLAASFAREVHDGGAVVLYGRSDEDLGIPYQPWTEMLTHLVLHAPNDLLTEHVSDRGSELARLVPELSKRVQATVSSPGDGEAERYLLFGSVVDLLVRVSLLAPVVIVLDDLHWADRPSVQLLRHVITADRRMRLLIIGTYRDSDLTADHPLAEALAALHRESYVERLALRGLGDDELLALLEATAGHEMTDEGVALRDALLAETEGNPFFVGEILRHLAETGTIYQDEQGRWNASRDLRARGLPVSIREVIARRIGRLGSEAERVLSIAAVIGRDFDVGLLGVAAELQEDALVDLCDRAVSASVLSETDDPNRYTFAHALIEHTLYDGLSTARRARAHRAIAETLEEICGTDPGDRVGEIAYHWAHAIQPQDSNKAIEYAQRAGDHAMARLAPDEAVRWYRDALELLDRMDDDVRRRLLLLVGLGDAQRLTGDPAHRETLLEAGHRAIVLGDHPLLVRAALANNRGWASRLGEEDHDRTALLRSALDVVPSDDSAERAGLLALLATELTFAQGHDAERIALADEAVAMARRLGDPSTFVDVVYRCDQPLFVPDRLNQRVSSAADARRFADSSGDPILQFRANYAGSYAALDNGDRAAFEDSVNNMRATASRIGIHFFDWQATLHEAHRALLAGDPVEAESLADQVLAKGLDGGQNDSMILYSGLILMVRWQQGRLAELIPLVQQSVQDQPGLPIFEAVLAWAYAHERLLPDAEQVVSAGRHREFRMPYEGTWLAAQCLWGEAVAVLRDRESAELLYHRLEPWTRQIAGTHTSLNYAVAYPAALLQRALGNLEAAERLLTEANEVHENVGSPHMTCLSQTALAEVLLTRAHDGDAEHARRILEDTLPIATERGYGYIQRDATALFDQIG